MQNIEVLALGGCNIRGPLYRVSGQKPRDQKISREIGIEGIKVSGPSFRTLTIGEMLQAISCFRGDRKIPAEIYDLCHVSVATTPRLDNSPLERSDVALIEPNTSIEIVFDGYYINPLRLFRLTESLKNIGQDARRLNHLWYNKGIVGGDEELKRDTAEQLIPLIPDDLEGRDLLVATLRSASGSRRDLLDGLRLVVDALGIPCGVVAYTWSYMPDGRPVTWPTGYHETVVGAARALGLPLFDPRPFVQEAGVAVSLQKDLRHYQEPFMAMLARPLVDFVRSLPAREA